MKRIRTMTSWTRQRIWPLLGGGLLLGAAILFGLHLERTALVDEYRFYGLDRVKESELLERVELPVGVHPDSLDLMHRLEPLLSHPWVRDVGIRRQAGGRMAIDVTEREPIAILISSRGRCYADREGVRMEMRGPVMDLPLVHGFDCRTGAPLEGVAWRDIQAFLTTVKSDPVSWHTLSEVGWNREEGVTALTQENGVKLLFGQGDYERKSRYWSRFYQEVISREGIGGFERVDLRFQGQIVTRKS